MLYKTAKKKADEDHIKYVKRKMSVSEGKGWEREDKKKKGEHIDTMTARNN